MSFRRGLAASLLAGTMLISMAGVALGHECVISSRSAQGDAGALHSGRWVRLTLPELYGFIHLLVGKPALTAVQIEWAVGESIDQGLPADGWVVRADKTIGEGSKNKNLGNGKGLDHLEDLVGAQVVGIYFQALGH
jgi:hypothetical protein